MSDNAEGGIAGVQARAAQTEGLEKHHRGTVGYLNERVLVFVISIGAVGLVGLWATTDSALITYSSLAGVLILIVLWGVLRIRGIQRLREDRARQAREAEARR